MYEEILSELKEEPVEILPEIKDEPEPLNLADFNISHSLPPSESEQKQMCLDHFERYLCSKYGFDGVYALKRAIDVITDFEEE